ncbi:hypothetical protein IQ215_02290 [Cyanobacterium stanieri LEGE 03274]|uniref:Uncharacterized protein n=1 Tax=Cyanobacterium stanieri LEGE 03274 TaxID=1828756 RepID=A0ABR9V0W4_9CHRO|nr:hypothetical protein [Cyanobacterium stanieri]MBE9221517.1 hypothetical protein [Cyanobacterium stanieri LEGE 03274]
MLFKQYFIFYWVKILLIKVTISLLFFPPALNLLMGALVENNLSYRFFSGGLFLFCLEQCRMAIVDLNNYFIATQDYKNKHISFYFFVLCITIALEIIGFYWMYYYINIGATIILLSQLWFNSLAKIKISIVNQEVIIYPWTINKRIGELLGALLGIILIILWTLNIYPLTMGFLMLSMMIIFTTIKYAIPTLKKTLKKLSLSSSNK